MNRRLVELYLQQGRLLERIEVQRADLKRHISPLQRAAQQADSALMALQNVVQAIRSHPLTVLTLIASLVLLKPRRAWGWGVLGLRLWRNWQRLQRWLPLRTLWR